MKVICKLIYTKLDSLTLNKWYEVIKLRGDYYIIYDDSGYTSDHWSGRFLTEKQYNHQKFNDKLDGLINE